MVLVTPKANEKAYMLVNGQNTYIFDVPMNANKNQVVEAVESQYGVKVKSVKTLVQNGKAVRYSRGKRRYPGVTTRKDKKKAYVTLVAGDSIKVFDEVEQGEEK